ncbi:acyl-CoA thioesterase [Parachitinimonas caeni]|uniref:Thioesterase family protein n=1 Tax=Parachitinimonas caeni TaxID=3031301 RepID=A0ABT7E436_9NEIS|nr:thioesterase family protein [Parachitinimonas caeni]MDK2126098.1 thioesterase family protein [Parachitinimonas caeni]
MPDSYPFRTEMEIQIGLINYGGHLGNDSALTLVHEARMRFLRALGFSELDIAGKGIILADAALVFKAEAFWGEKLSVGVAAIDFNKYGCDLYYCFESLERQREVLHAKTGLVFFDYTVRKPVGVPPEFSAALNAYTQESDPN